MILMKSAMFLENQQFPAKSIQEVEASVGWFVSLLVREEVPLVGLCERKILLRLEIYDRLRQATAKRAAK